MLSNDFICIIGNRRTGACHWPGLFEFSFYQRNVQDYIMWRILKVVRHTWYWILGGCSSPNNSARLRKATRFIGFTMSFSQLSYLFCSVTWMAHFQEYPIIIHYPHVQWFSMRKHRGFPQKTSKNTWVFPKPFTSSSCSAGATRPREWWMNWPARNSDSSLHPSRLPQGVDWWYTNSLKVFDMFAICLINLVENM